jgi:hypothetical protein
MSGCSWFVGDDPGRAAFRENDLADLEIGYGFPTGLSIVGPAREIAAS